MAPKKRQQHSNNILFILLKMIIALVLTHGKWQITVMDVYNLFTV